MAEDVQMVNRWQRPGESESVPVSPAPTAESAADDDDQLPAPPPATTISAVSASGPPPSPNRHEREVSQTTAPVVQQPAPQQQWTNGQSGPGQQEGPRWGQPQAGRPAGPAAPPPQNLAANGGAHPYSGQTREIPMLDPRQLQSLLAQRQAAPLVQRNEGAPARRPDHAPAHRQDHAHRPDHGPAHPGPPQQQVAPLHRPDAPHVEMAPQHRTDSRAAEADQYRRPGAPMQAAGAGIRQELFAVAQEERSPRANSGFRGVLNSLGLRLGPSAKERKYRELLRRIRAPKDAMYSIAVLTLKGGAGKTTLTAALGQVFSSIRPDGVVAVDADPDSGDLPMRTTAHPQRLSMVEMLEAEDLSQRDFVQRFLSTTDADLQVLSNGWRPDSDRVLVPDDISDIHEIASHYYSMLLWDGDKALNSPLVRKVLEKSNALVLMVEASTPGATKAADAIDWLRFHGFEGLLARTVLVVNETTDHTRLDMKSLLTVLARQQLKIHHIPFDKHLDEGLSVDLAKLKKKTRRAFEELAGMLADDFVIPQPPAAVAAGKAAS